MAHGEGTRQLPATGDSNTPPSPSALLMTKQLTMNLSSELLGDPQAVRTNRQGVAVVVAVGAEIPAHKT